jgi:K+-sensing histidine kinase KdpD
MRPGGDFTSEDAQLLPDLFHALNQPLTTLQCCLELCLPPANRLDKRVRRHLRLALRQVESVVRVTGNIRELVNPQAMEVIREETDFNDCVREMAADLSPVAESENKKISLRVRYCGPVNIAANRLREVLFRVIEFAIHRARTSTTINVSAKRRENAAVLTIGFVGSGSPTTTVGKLKTHHDEAPQDRVDLAIAGRIIAAAEGDLEVEKHSNRYALKFRLPVAAQEPALALAHQFRRRA